MRRAQAPAAVAGYGIVPSTGIPAAVVRAPGGPLLLSARRAAAILRATGADPIRVAERAAAERPVVFYRGDQPVAVLMPMRMKDGQRLIIPRDAADAGRLEGLGAAASATEAEARRLYASRHGGTALSRPHYVELRGEGGFVHVPSADTEALADYQRLGFRPREFSTAYQPAYARLAESAPAPAPPGTPVAELLRVPQQPKRGGAKRLDAPADALHGRLPASASDSRATQGRATRGTRSR